MEIAKKIGFGILITLLLVYMFIIISPRIFTGFYPFGIKTAVVLTGSMAPTIEINDFVIMKAPSEINAGDIVSYKESDGASEILHRIVRIEDDKVITKGDANNTEDKPIDSSQVTGVYLGKIEGLGKILSFTTQPIVFSIMMVILLVLLLAPYKGIKVKKSKVNNNDKK